MVTELQANTVQWGYIVFSLDNEAFRKGFESGRRYYFIDAHGEELHRATNLSARELLHQIAVPDAKSGHYRFDEEAIAHLEEYLGVISRLHVRPITSIDEHVKASMRGYPSG